MYLMDPSTAEVLKIPMGIDELHRREFAEDGPDLLEAPWYASYRDATGWAGELGFDRCIGHRLPRIMGGEDDLDNLEEWDRDVYWTICGQAYNQLNR